MIDLWNPAHVSLGIDLLTALLLGMVHGVTPDEHTWPITFSYAVGSYSTWRGLRAGLIFSLAFTLQRAIASELAYLGLSRLLTFAAVDFYVYVVVGAVMVWAGLAIAQGRMAPHLHLRPSPPRADPFADPRPWMPALHGFIAGWGFGAFATILYTVLAPAMPSAAWGWTPGAAFGLGTTLVQIFAGAAFGYWAARRGLPAEAIRRVGLLTAARTLLWGGGAFVLAGLFGIGFPRLADLSFDSGIKVHNLHSIGLPFLLVVGVVIGVGFTSLLRETATLRRAVPRG
ncbi:hypothetical protein AiwAL_07895 [Acidiphilium sp. AL]|uniref:Urease accessory protein UreH-like transmembrane domain-containing protein n=1 Tax=Acidiphilium iwatense TaxID=768198 RepID=A0ABS9E2J9_9PROT|nr:MULTISPECIES: sulfite exporter TauE/SafE family protein [Acidiphilium]MCF3947877.1 hypothetical protein [Acidiphilium iwatense]MCU4160028.1 hypothetical protein [Acidiphilium sp. AL]